MSFPTSPFLIAVGKCGLFTPAQIQSISSSRERPESLAIRLVASNELTQFQADKLLVGLWQGLTLGPYRVLAPIGRGGMGIVYLAAKGSTNSSPRVALKILPPRIAREEPRRLERFRREIRIGSAIPPHDHIARTYEGGDVSGVHYLAMEFVPGITLRKRVQERGPISPTETARICVGLADGLVHLHAINVIHRDFKPANVMLSPGGRAKILDFGFALVLGESLPTDPRVVGGQGYVIGTMDYIAPEQIQDATTVTPAADLYSLGCTLFYSLTGTPPYPGGDAQQKLRWHQTSEPPDVRSISPSVPEELARLVSRLLRKDPERRPASARDVREQLHEIAGPEVLTIDPVGIDTAVELLTHQKVATEELLEPIILDDGDETEPECQMKEDRYATRNSTAPLFWYFIAGLVFLIAVFLSTLLFLLATRNS